MYSVNTFSALVEGVIISRAIRNLTLNERNFLELALLIPGKMQIPGLITPGAYNIATDA